MEKETLEEQEENICEKCGEETSIKLVSDEFYDVCYGCGHINY